MQAAIRRESVEFDSRNTRVIHYLPDDGEPDCKDGWCEGDWKRLPAGLHTSQSPSPSLLSNC